MGFHETFRQLENIRRDFDRFFTSDLSPFRILGHQNFAGPSIDIHETDNEVVAGCDIPGLNKRENVDIQIDNNVLTISGTVNRTNEVKEENLHRSERFVGRFQRSISLPCHVNNEGTKASYKNGVLEIRMPKTQMESKKKVDIDFH
jgi:HSP20 family protein